MWINSGSDQKIELNESHRFSFSDCPTYVVLVCQPPLIISLLASKSSGAVMCLYKGESVQKKPQDCLNLLNAFSLNSPSLAECGGRFKGETSGRILSPGYPFPYDNNLRCTWAIEVDSGNIIRFLFSLFRSLWRHCLSAHYRPHNRAAKRSLSIYKSQMAKTSHLYGAKETPDELMPHRKCLCLLLVRGFGGLRRQSHYEV